MLLTPACLPTCLLAHAELCCLQRLSAVVANYGKLLIASRNLDFFTSFYRFLIQLLPAAVVAPLFFAGFGGGAGGGSGRTRLVGKLWVGGGADVVCACLQEKLSLV